MSMVCHLQDNAPLIAQPEKMDEKPKPLEPQTYGDLTLQQRRAKKTHKEAVMLEL